jgi:hypothetical protein
MLVETKHCSKCETTKPIDDFGKNCAQKDGRCNWCRKCKSEFNKKDPYAMVLDHIDNGGTAHRREIAQSRKNGVKIINSRRSGYLIYQDLKNKGYPPGIQVLCASCNQAKMLNGGKIPMWRVKPLIRVFTLSEYARKSE